MTTQTCHSQYIKHVLEHMHQNSQLVLNTIMSIICALVPEDHLNTPILNHGSSVTSYTVNDMIKEITHIHDFTTLSYIPLHHVYNTTFLSPSSWLKYTRKRQLDIFKHIYLYIYSIKKMRNVIGKYMQLSDHQQKITQNKFKNEEQIVSKIVSVINRFYNIINQEYQKYIKQPILPINPSKKRSDMITWVSFFNDIGHLRQTSKKIRDLVTTNYPIVQTVGSSLVKFIQSPQQSNGDHDMVHHLVSLLSIKIARQT